MYYQNPYYFNNYYNDFYYRKPFFGGYHHGRSNCTCRGGFCRCDFGRRRYQRDYWGGWGY